MKVLCSLRTALDDPRVLGGLLDGPSWSHWRALLLAAMGEPLTEDEREAFRAITGRDHEPAERCDELWAVIGRRGGKTRAISVLAAYIAACVDYRGVLAPGEDGIVAVLAATVRQAEIALSYISAIFGDKSRPLFHRMVKNETQEAIELSNHIVIEVRPASFRSIRGITAVAVIADEIAFFSSGDGAANPDTEILNALRPALATTGGVLIAISSPYARKGELWSTYAEHYGPQGDPRILVAQAASRTMNSTLPQRVVDRALVKDRSAASAEYLAMFRSDVESFVALEKVNAAIQAGRTSLPFDRCGVPFYVGFLDPAGGSGADAMTMGIAHAVGDRVILDIVEEVLPPFSPDEVTARFAARFKDYAIRKVTSDRFAGDWPASRFRVHGIEVETSAEPKSQIYGAFLPLINAGRVELLDHDKLRSQLMGLERRANPGGRDIIDHPRGGHDDVVNAAAGAVTIAAASIDQGFDWGADDFMAGLNHFASSVGLQ